MHITYTSTAAFRFKKVYFSQPQATLSYAILAPAISQAIFLTHFLKHVWSFNFRLRVSYVHFLISHRFARWPFFGWAAHPEASTCTCLSCARYFLDLGISPAIFLFVSFFQPSPPSTPPIVIPSLMRLLIHGLLYLQSFAAGIGFRTACGFSKQVSYLPIENIDMPWLSYFFLLRFRLQNFLTVEFLNMETCSTA